MANYVSYYLKVDAPIQVGEGRGGLGGEGMTKLERKKFVCVKWKSNAVSTKGC